MDFLGVGPLELFFIVIIALIVLGPQDMIKAGRNLGRFLRKIVTSPTWKAVQQTSRDFRNLPNRLIREAGIEEEMKDLNKIKGDVERMGSMGVNQLSQDAKDINKELSEVNKDIQKTHQEVLDTHKDFSAWTTPPVIEPPSSPVINSQFQTAKDEATDLSREKNSKSQVEQQNRDKDPLKDIANHQEFEGKQKEES
jgi:Sec-independent protein translocase protein TatA